jgi:hypothetical protein
MRRDGFLQKILGARFMAAGARAFDMGRLLDTLLVCAVATILIIRTQLWLSNYPQLGGHGLHIAHLLWGGLGMLVAIVVLVVYLNPIARVVGAVLGGIGLGFFIDELGKFLTSDNNYFFKPTAVIIYIFFIGFFVVARALQRRRGFSEREYLVNAIDLAKDAAIRDMDAAEQREALALLDLADQSDPLVERTRALLLAVPVRSEEEPSAIARLLHTTRDGYFRLTEKHWFIVFVTGVFALWAVGTIAEIIALIVTDDPHLTVQRAARIGGQITASKPGHYGFVETANIATSFFAGALVAVGLVLLKVRSRLVAYAWFEWALYVSIFLTQVFAFVQSQFGACVGFVFDVLLLITLRFMQRSERARALHAQESPAAEAPAGAPA